MAKNATPATLFELAQAEAHRQHRLRMEQLERARATLAELDKDRNPLKSADVVLDICSDYLWDYAEKALVLSTYSVHSVEMKLRLLLTLVGCGWKLVSRTNTTPSWSTARLRRGRYRIIVTYLPPVREEQPQATAQPSEATPA